MSQLNLHSEEGRLRILTLQLDNTRESLVKAGERRRNALDALDSLNVALVTLDMRRSFWELRHSVFAAGWAPIPVRRPSARVWPKCSASASGCT